MNTYINEQEIKEWGFNFNQKARGIDPSNEIEPGYDDFLGIEIL